jgi:MFS family permease
MTATVGFGVGPIIGAGVGGFVYQEMGPGVLYVSASVLALSAAVVAWFALRIPDLDRPRGVEETPPVAPFPDTGPTV